MYYNDTRKVTHLLTYSLLTFNFVDFRHDSTKHASMMVLAVPKVMSYFECFWDVLNSMGLDLGWRRENNLIIIITIYIIYILYI